MASSARLLGFAFTNADFLFEMDKSGTILFAAGAANDLVKESNETLVGKPAGKLFKPSEGIKFATFSKALKSGDRAGPYKLTLATGAEANLAMFRLPQNGTNISCSLARPGVRTPVARVDPKTGLASRDGFMAAAEKAGPDDALTLVNVPNLPEICAELPAEKASALMQRIGDTLQSCGANATGQLSDTSFGAVTPAASGKLDLAKKLAEAFTADGLTALAVTEAQVALTGAGLTPEQRLLSLRYVIDRFAQKGKIEGDGDISGAFSQMMDETQRRLADLTQAVGNGNFQIAYQPICELSSGKTSHYEALARFSGKQDTGETVQFMEALGIAGAFDLAVANKVITLVDQLPDVHVAFNVSAETIANPASFGVLAGMLARRRRLAPRLLIEVTETGNIGDLETAGKAIAALREMGYRVGLDDFGAGAASLNYLHAFTVDFVKFDGKLIHQIGQSQRDDALLAGLAKLCGEMKVDTIAEWIESEAMAKAALGLGFRHGQGRWMGPPLAEIPAAAPPVGKRKGVQQSWG
jgi:EAL domain-containing protein (putative c-di-GMP-specific phosphodiesterase class I)